jgi:methylmalonyl-CoA/ethylmalonyl-CoA epimerase
MPEIKRINHIAVLVEDIDVSLKFWNEILGMEPSGISDMPAEAARIAFLPLGESEIDWSAHLLIETTATSTRLARICAGNWMTLQDAVARSQRISSSTRSPK